MQSLTDLQSANDLEDRITIDPKIMGGRVCMRGMPSTIALSLNLLANGMSESEIVRDYPPLEVEDIHAALKFAARSN